MDLTVLEAHDGLVNATDETGAPPPSSSSEPPRPAPGLTRSTDDKVLAGLAGGLGRHFGIDPVIFRIAFVVLALAGGTGILLYLLGWLVVPDDRGGRAVMEGMVHTRTGQLVLAVVAGILVIGLFDGWGDGWSDFPLAVVLIGGGLAYLWARRAPSAGGGDSGPQSQVAGVSPPMAPPPPRAVADAGPVLAPPVETVRPRSVLVPVTLSLLAVLGGVLALAGASLATGLAIALLFVSAAMVVGAWRGRARGLIPVAVVLAGALCLASLVDVPLAGGIGDRMYAPQSFAELDSPYRLGIGQLELDLSSVDFAGRTESVLATVGIGELRVVVPPAVEVVVTGHAGAGELDLFSWHEEGTSVDHRVVSPGQEGGGRLQLRSRVGIGHVEVDRAAA